MKTYKYALNVKQSNGQWKHSPEENSFVELTHKYGKWLDEHPTVAFTIIRRVVITANQV